MRNVDLKIKEKEHRKQVKKWRLKMKQARKARKMKRY